MAIEPLTEPIVSSDPTADAQPPEPARSRRSILGAGLVLGSLGRPAQAQAASGGSLVMGAANSAGTTNTSLTTASTGTALLVTQTGAGTALRGSATAALASQLWYTKAILSAMSRSLKTMVTSLPPRFTSALPSGTKYSPSGTGPFAL